MLEDLPNVEASINEADASADLLAGKSLGGWYSRNISDEPLATNSGQTAADDDASDNERPTKRVAVDNAGAASSSTTVSSSQQRRGLRRAKDRKSVV